MNIDELKGKLRKTPHHQSYFLFLKDLRPTFLQVKALLLRQFALQEIHLKIAVGRLIERWHDLFGEQPHGFEHFFLRHAAE